MLVSLTVVCMTGKKLTYEMANLGPPTLQKRFHESLSTTWRRKNKRETIGRIQDNDWDLIGNKFNIFRKIWFLFRLVFKEIILYIALYYIIFAIEHFALSTEQQER